jgi:hypothetical protein
MSEPGVAVNPVVLACRGVKLRMGAVVGPPRQRRRRAPAPGRARDLRVGAGS